MQVNNLEKEKEVWQNSIVSKSKLNSMEVLINKALIDSNISHDEFVLMNNALKEYDKLKEEIKYKKTLISLTA